MLHQDHEIHIRRRGRNFGLLIILLGFIAVIFALTVVKVQTIGPIEGFDHVTRPALLPTEGSE